MGSRRARRFVRKRGPFRSNFRQSGEWLRLRAARCTVIRAAHVAFLCEIRSLREITNTNTASAVSVSQPYLRTLARCRACSVLRRRANSERRNDATKIKQSEINSQQISAGKSQAHNSESQFDGQIESRKPRKRALQHHLLSHSRKAGAATAPAPAPIQHFREFLPVQYSP